jgi:hypothetical protein
VSAAELLRSRIGLKSKASIGNAPPCRNGALDQETKWNN